MFEWTLVQRHTCVRGRGETSGWEKKPSPPTLEGTSDILRDERQYEGMCHLTMHVTCHAVSVDQLRAEMHTQNFESTWQLFLLDCKNSLWPLANTSLSCSWNISYCALGRTLAAMCELKCNSARHCKKNSRQTLSFWKWRNGGDTSPTAALSGCGFGQLTKHTDQLTPRESAHFSLDHLSQSTVCAFVRVILAKAIQLLWDMYDITSKG